MVITVLSYDFSKYFQILLRFFHSVLYLRQQPKFWIVRSRPFGSREYSKALVEADKLCNRFADLELGKHLIAISQSFWRTAAPKHSELCFAGNEQNFKKSLFWGRVTLFLCGTCKNKWSGLGLKLKNQLHEKCFQWGQKTKKSTPVNVST